MRLHLLLHTLLLLHCLAAAAQPTLLKPTGRVDQLTNADGTIYFVRQPSPGQGQLWKSNGTAAGTVLVKEFVGQPYELTNVNGTLFFVVRGYEAGYTLWKSGGTAATTVPLKSLGYFAGPCCYFYEPENLTAVDGTLFFTQYTEAYGLELWKSDGTSAGTQLVKDISPGPTNTYFSGLVAFRHRLYFTLNSDSAARGFWGSDGTAAGTQPVRTDVYPERTVTTREAVFFITHDGQLWTSDGTSGGSRMLKEGLNTSDAAYNLTPVGNRVYFLESTGTRYTLWKSDGTKSGTVVVKTGIGTTTRPPYAFTAVNGQLYFANYADGTYRLWRSDGSGAGTVELKNFGNTYFLQPNQLTAVGNTLYFEANNALWRSQGTPSGTVNLRQIHSATDVLDPTEMRNANGVLFLAATNQAATTGLWRYLPPEESIKWLVNTGGSSHYTAGGRLFAADTDQKAGGTLSRRVSGPVANTSEDELYRSNRHGSLLTYRFAVEPGTYDVTLHFCETYWGNLVPGGAGSRAFHVDMEGQRKLTDYDTYAKAGGAMRAVRETFRVTVADSVLTVTFRQGSADLAHVAALEVVQVKPPAATARIATETGAGLAVSLWPNPVHDRLTLRFGAAPGPASVTIADAAGRLHRAESRLRVHGEQAEVDVSSLPAGLYLLRVQAGSAHAVRKFVKE